MKKTRKKFKSSTLDWKNIRSAFKGYDYSDYPKVHDVFARWISYRVGQLAQLEGSDEVKQICRIAVWEGVLNGKKDNVEIDIMWAIKSGLYKPYRMKMQRMRGGGMPEMNIDDFKIPVKAAGNIIKRIGVKIALKQMIDAIMPHLTGKQQFIIETLQKGYYRPVEIREEMRKKYKTKYTPNMVSYLMHDKRWGIAGYMTRYMSACNLTLGDFI